MIFYLLVFLNHSNAQCPVTINGGGVFCSNSCIILQATGASTYTWSANTGSVINSTVSVCPSATTIYTVSGTTAACVATQTIVVTVLSAISASIASTPPSCGQCNGTATVNVSGEAAPYQITWSTGATPAVVMNLCAGIYPCAITDSNGCRDTVTAVLSNSSGPISSFTLTPDSTPHVWDVSLGCYGGAPPYSYSWSWGDGSANDTIANPSHIYTTAGWYNICVNITDANLCNAYYCQNDNVYRKSSGNSMITVDVLNNSTGINQSINKGIDISFYPNPTRGQFFIEANISEKLTLDIYDINGRNLFRSSVIDHSTIDVTTLNEGIYTLVIKTVNYVINKKLVILR